MYSTALYVRVFVYTQDLDIRRGTQGLFSGSSCEHLCVILVCVLMRLRVNSLTHRHVHIFWAPIDFCSVLQIRNIEIWDDSTDEIPRVDWLKIQSGLAAQNLTLSTSGKIEKVFLE